MAGQSLHTLIQTQMNSKSGKTRVGYTAPQYANVLAYLETYLYIIKKVMGDPSYRPAGDFSPTQGLSSGEFSVGDAYSTYGSLNGLSIKVLKNTNWTDTFQGRCKFVDYMSFCVDKDGKRLHVKVSPFGFYTVSSMDEGNSFCGKGTHPATTREATQNGVWLLDYVVGICLDFSTFVKGFLERFFGKDAIGASMDELKTIACKKQMFAEVLLPKKSFNTETTTNNNENEDDNVLMFLDNNKNTELEQEQEDKVYSGNFYVVHMPVTLYYNIENQNFFNVYLPAPLFLLNDFKSVANVLVDVGDNKWQKVGLGNVTFPFAGNKYNHKTGTIHGFNKKAFENATEVQSITNSRIEHENDFGFVRVFFDKAAEEALKIDDSKIKNKNELFKGQYDTNKLITRDVVYSSGNVSLTSTLLMAMYAEFGAQLSPPMSGGDVEKAIDTAAHFESSNKWSTMGDINDGQGFSCGYLQFTVAAEGHLVFCLKYKETAKSKGYEIPESLKLVLDKIKSTKRITNATLFAKMLANDCGKVAQIATWSHEKGEQTKELFAYLTGGDKTVASPLLLASVVGAINHLPEIMLKWFKEKNIAQYRSNPSLMIRHAEAAHWTCWFDWKRTNYIKSYQYVGIVPSTTKFLELNGAHLLSRQNGANQLKDVDGDKKVEGMIYRTDKDYSEGQFIRCATIVKAALDGKFNIERPLGRISIDTKFDWYPLRKKNQ